MVILRARKESPISASFVDEGLELLKSFGAQNAAVIAPGDAEFEVLASYSSGEDSKSPAFSRTVLRKAAKVHGPLLLANVSDNVSPDTSSKVIRLKSALVVKLRAENGEIIAFLYGDTEIGDKKFEHSEVSRALAFVARVERHLRASRLRGALEQNVLKKARKTKKARSISRPPKLGRPSRNALPVFFRSLGTMLDSGIVCLRGLEVLANHSEDPVMALVCSMMAKRLREGAQLSQAMAEFPLVFRSMHISMLKLGEETGRMGETIAAIGDFEEKLGNIEMRVRSALTYPSLVFLLCALGAVFGPPLLLEGHFELIRTSGIEPPLLTTLVMAFSDMTRSLWFYAFSLVLALFALKGVKMVRSRPEYRLVLIENAMRIPVLGRFLRTAATTRFAEALALALDVGVQADKGMLMAAAASGNPVLERDMHVCRSALINDGLNISQSLGKSSFFPPLLLHMVSVGEDTADLPRMIRWVAELYETQMEHAVESFTALLEPLVMAFVGGVVAILVLATMLPLVDLMSTF